VDRAECHRIAEFVAQVADVCATVLIKGVCRFMVYAVAADVASFIAGVCCLQGGIFCKCHAVIVLSLIGSWCGSCA